MTSTSPGIPGVDTSFFVVEETEETTTLHLNACLNVGTTHLEETGRTYVDIEELRTSFDLLQERGRKALTETRGLMGENCTLAALQALDLLHEALLTLDSIERARMKEMQGDHSD